MKPLINKDNLHKTSITYMIKIENPKYMDLLIPGNIVEIMVGNKPHHGIVIPPNIAKRFFYSYRGDSSLILTAHNETSVSYWTVGYFNTKFLGLNSSTKIEKVYSTDIDVNKLKNTHDVWEIYKRFKLIFI